MAGDNILGSAFSNIVPGGNIWVPIVFFAALLLLGILAALFYYYRLFKHNIEIIEEYGGGINRSIQRCRIIYGVSGEPKELAFMFSKRRLPFPPEGLTAIPQGDALFFYYYKDGNNNYKPLHFDTGTLTFRNFDTDDKSWYEHKVVQNVKTYNNNPMVMFVVSVALIGILALGCGIMLYYFADKLTGTVQNHDNTELARVESAERQIGAMANLTERMDYLLDRINRTGQQAPSYNNGGGNIIVTGGGR